MPCTQAPADSSQCPADADAATAVGMAGRVGRPHRHMRASAHTEHPTPTAEPCPLVRTPVHRTHPDITHHRCRCLPLLRCCCRCCRCCSCCVLRACCCCRRPCTRPCTRMHAHDGHARMHAVFWTGATHPDLLSPCVWPRAAGKTPHRPRSVTFGDDRRRTVGSPPERTEAGVRGVSPLPGAGLADSPSRRPDVR